MWTSSVIAVVIVLISVALLEILVRKGAIQLKSMQYRCIEIFGFYFPSTIICANYAYLKTDTLGEMALVIVGICFFLALWFLFLNIFASKKYNFIAVSILLFGTYFMIILITPYMLSNISSNIFLYLIGTTIGSSISRVEYKGRLIISTIIVGLIILTAPNNLLGNFATNNKVEHVSVAFIQSKGIDTTPNLDFIYWGSSNRNEPINLSILLKSSQVKEITREIKLTYYKGQIVELEESE